MRVAAAGVCRSDLHIAAGKARVPLPLVLGHEIAGTAAGIGDVLVYPAWGCGACVFCRRGEEQLCPEEVEAGWTRDGGYAEAMVVPSARYLIPLDGLDPVHAAPLVDAGVTPYRAVRRVAPLLEPGAVAIVVGVGGLGQFAVQYLRLLTDARVVAVDVSDEKRVRALELGAEEALPPVELGRRARVVLDFVGSDETLALAARTVEPGGAIVLVGEAGGLLAFGFETLALEVAAMTSVLGSISDLRAVVELARRGEIRWSTETMPLERANEAHDRLRRGEVAGRLVLVP